MALESDVLVDRRRLKRRLTFWRVVAVVAGWVVVSTVTYVLTWWNLRVVREAQGNLRITRGLLTTHSQTVERAKGALMTTYGMTEPQAFKWIQRTAMDHRMTMREVAERILAETANPAPETPPAGWLSRCWPSPACPRPGGSKPTDWRRGCRCRAPPARLRTCR